MLGSDLLDSRCAPVNVIRSGRFISYGVHRGVAVVSNNHRREGRPGHPVRSRAKERRPGSSWS